LFYFDTVSQAFSAEIFDIQTNDGFFSVLTIQDDPPTTEPPTTGTPTTVPPTTEPPTTGMVY
jgi:hypothetical protein